MKWTKHGDYFRYGAATVWRDRNAPDWCGMYNGRLSFHQTKRAAKDWCEAAVKEANVVEGSIEI